MKLEQAVILAGGRGLRMRPLTDQLPKPMIQVAGKPFLEHLLESLKREGVKEVLLLLGYLAEHIQEHFEDGSRFGLKISYSVLPEEFDTGARIHAAVGKIAPHFLLLYCDNYWPLQLKPMVESYLRHQCKGQITVYQNRDNFTKHNLLLDGRDFVINYDKTRKRPGLSGVDIGYGIFDSSILSLLTDENTNFESLVYPMLVENRQLAAFKTHHRYYSIGSLDRLPVTDQYFRNTKVILLDRDGVLNEKAKKADYIKSWSEFRWKRGAREALVYLKKNGFSVFVISNQAGINRGIMSQGDVDQIHSLMQRDLSSLGSGIDKFYICPHHWEENCECRKPKAGLLFQAQRENHFDLTKTYFIGDDLRDVEAANHAGCLSKLIKEDESLLDMVRTIEV